MLAGRLNGNVRGRPVNLIAENRDLVFQVGNFRTLLILRHSWRFVTQSLPVILGGTGVRVSVQMNRLGTVEIFPKPSFLVQLLLPRSD